MKSFGACLMVLNIVLWNLSGVVGCGPGNSGANTNANMNDNSNANLNMNSNVNTNGSDDLMLGVGHFEAISAALESIKSFVHATQAVVAAARFDPAARGRRPRGLDCPQTNVDMMDDVTLDYGAECLVLGVPGYVCTGTAAGHAEGAAINLQFDEMSCQSRVFDGLVDVTVESGGGFIGIGGQWQLELGFGVTKVTTAGSGSCNFGGPSLRTAILFFDGTMNLGSDEFMVTIDDIVVSFVEHGSFIPEGGTYHLSSDALGNLGLRFTADSPVSGNFQVTLGTQTPVTLNVDDLD